MDIIFVLLYRTRYFYSEILQNHLIYIFFSTKNILDFLVTHLKFYNENLNNWQKNILKI